MALQKVDYIDRDTHINAENLNAIQDAIIALEGQTLKTNSLGEADDLDNITAPRMSFCTDVANKPSNSGRYGYILALTPYVQIYMEYSTSGAPRVFFRYYTNNQWYPWRYVTTTAV